MIGPGGAKRRRLLSTAVNSAVAYGFAVTAFDLSILASVLLTAACGPVMLAVDRLLVRSMPLPRHPHAVPLGMSMPLPRHPHAVPLGMSMPLRRRPRAAPRLFLALLFGTILSIPVMAAASQAESETELSVIRSEQVATRRVARDQLFADLDLLRARVAELERGTASGRATPGQVATADTLLSQRMAAWAATERELDSRYRELALEPVMYPTIKWGVMLLAIVMLLPMVETLAARWVWRRAVAGEVTLPEGAARGVADVGVAARRLVDAMVRALPRTDRERWHEEFHAELYDLAEGGVARGCQFVYTLRLLKRLLALRAQLRRPATRKARQ